MEQTHRENPRGSADMNAAAAATALMSCRRAQLENRPRDAQRAACENAVGVAERLHGAVHPNTILAKLELERVQNAARDRQGARATRRGDRRRPRKLRSRSPRESMIPTRLAPLLTRESSRALDRHAIEALGIPGVVLMENAGRGAFEVLLREHPRALERVALIGGPGQNGGDAWVVARHLARLGFSPCALMLIPGGDASTLGGTRPTQWPVLAALGIECAAVDPASPGPNEGAGRSARGRDAHRDGLFGTGLTRDVEGGFAAAVEQINARGGARRARGRLGHAERPLRRHRPGAGHVRGRDADGDLRGDQAGPDAAPGRDARGGAPRRGYRRPGRS